MSRGCRARAPAVALAVLLGACSGKAASARQPPPDLEGLAAIPDTAQVVIGAQPAGLASSAVVRRAVDQMLARDPALEQRLGRIAARCQVDVAALDTVHVALTSQAPQVVLVVTGALAEGPLTACVQGLFAGGGGSVTAGQVEGRTVYEVTEDGRSTYFAFGAKDTVVLSGSRELVVAGLGSGRKVLDAPELRALVDRADTRAPLWAVGRVTPDLGQRLLRLTGGAVKAPPTAFLARLDPAGGLAAELSVVMASEADAEALHRELEPLLGLVAMAAQIRGLGPLAAKLAGSRDGDRVRMGATLSEAEVKDLLAAVDSTQPSPQDATPAPSDPGGMPAAPGD